MHMHTEYSRDSRQTLRVFAAAAEQAGLNVVCVTDHDTVEGALRLREMNTALRVIVGEEIYTREGELIGLFLERAVPPGLSLEETIARIKDQNGLAYVPHPFSRNRMRHSLPGGAGSDSHRPNEIGRAYVEVPDFDGPEELLASLRSGLVSGTLSGIRAHLRTRYDVIRRWLVR